MSESVPFSFSTQVSIYVSSQHPQPPLHPHSPFLLSCLPVTSPSCPPTTFPILFSTHHPPSLLNHPSTGPFGTFLPLHLLLLHLFCLCSLSVLAFPGVNQACPLQPLPFHFQQTLTFPDTHGRTESRSTVLPPSIAPSFSSLPHIPVLCCNFLLLPVSLNMPNTWLAL